MRKRLWAVGGTVLGALSLFVGAAYHRGTSNSSPPTGPSSERAGVGTGRAAPLRFEANRGQFDEPVAFAARAERYSLFLTPEGATLSLRIGPEGSRTRTAKAGKGRQPNHAVETAVVRMRVVDGKVVRPEGSQPLAGVSNYLVGKDKAKWREGVENYARVRYPGVRPGVDLVFYGNAQGSLEYDLVLAPGTKAEGVGLKFDGVDSIEVETSGDLVLRAGGGEIRQPPPVAYQRSADGERRTVLAHYQQRDDGSVGFKVGPHDPSRELVIDPVLVYSTYLGGSRSDWGFAIAVDSTGSAFIVGTTASLDFPTASAIDSSVSQLGDVDAFVTKLDPSGAHVYSTYLGGAAIDEAWAVAVDGHGSAYVSGFTESADFPTESAFQSAMAGQFDGFVTKLSATGTLEYSTFLGGLIQEESTKGIAVDAAGAAYVTGWAKSPNPPPPGTENTDAFVAKLNPDGSSFAYLKYVGGSNWEYGSGVAVDSSGSAYLTGATGSPDFPTVAAFQPQLVPDPDYLVGGSDAFIAKLSADGSSFVYSSYLGGQFRDKTFGIAVDAAGAAYVTGTTESPDFPIAFAFQPTRATPSTIHSRRAETFVTKLNASGSTLIFSSYLGGGSQNAARGIAVDGAGSAYITGSVWGPDFPTLLPLHAYRGHVDAFLTKVSSSGILVSSTFLGGSSTDEGFGVAADSAGFVYATGFTTSENFPTKGDLQPSHGMGGNYNAYVTKLDLTAPAPPAVPATSGSGILLTAFSLVVISAWQLRQRRFQA